MTAPADRRPPAPELPTPTPGDPREPPSRSLIRGLIRAAEEAELLACQYAIREEETTVAATQARADHNAARNQAERCWSLAQLALRAHARRQPMPTEAEVVAAVAYRRSSTGARVAQIPEGAKAGDVIRNAGTGERFRLITGPDGVLYGLPLDGGGGA